MKFSTALGLLLVSALTANSQSFSWVKQFETTGSGEGRAISYGKSFCCTGSFQGTIDLDPGPGTSTVSSKGSNDIFISGLDQSGNLLWRQAIGGSGDDAGNCIYEDRLGNLYVGGYFSATVDFDPGPGTFALTSAGGTDAFILKLNAATGNFIWARQLGGTDAQTITSIVCDHMGNVYTTGVFTGACDFDPEAGTFLLTESGGGGNAFISKLNSSGGFIWAKELGANGASADGGNAIYTDNYGNIITTGYFEGTMDLDPGAGTSTVTSQGGHDIYILKLNLAGNLVWGKTIGSSSDDEGRSVRTEAISGDIYLTGSFSGNADFDPGAGSYPLSAAGSQDIFLMKLDSAGHFVWAKGIGSTGSDSGTGLAVDNTGKLYLTGYFTGTVDFDPGAGAWNLSSAGNEDVFVSTLDTSGHFLSAKSWGGTGSDHSNSIVAAALGVVYTTGSFNGTADFDPDAGIYNLTAVGNPDAFVHKMCDVKVIASSSHSVLCAGQTATLSSAGANFYNWAPSQDIWSTTVILTTPRATTVYTLTGTALGCTSTGTVSIIVNPLPSLSVTASPGLICSGNSSSLTVNGAASYSWSPGGETTAGIVVSPTVSTSYAVTGTATSGCSKTENISVNVLICTSLKDMTEPDEISIYPNPANDYVSISVPANIASANTKLEVRDAVGKLVMTETISQDITTLRLTELKDGLYFFKVISHNQTVKVGKVVKH